MLSQQQQIRFSAFSGLYDMIVPKDNLLRKIEMSPEEGVIDPSSLTKFRKLRLKDNDLLNLLINKTVTIAIERGIIRSKSIIVDATHSLSRSNPYSALDVLRERSEPAPQSGVCLCRNGVVSFIIISTVILNSKSFFILAVRFKAICNVSKSV
jgi:hypothetical protein